MPEILTESFCERCGTRYTFEAVAPKGRPLKRLQVLSKGLRNYVLSDETTLDEAFADARNDELRAISSQQLDAFHKTFNFCMSCRQYTCANCWNQVEGRCLTCAPHLGQEILPGPFPAVESIPHQMAGPDNGNGLHPEDHAAHMIEASAWPTVDLRPVGTEPPVLPPEPTITDQAPPGEPARETPEERAATGTARTTSFFARFRPEHDRATEAPTPEAEGAVAPSEAVAPSDAVAPSEAAPASEVAAEEAVAAAQAASPEAAEGLTPEELAEISVSAAIAGRARAEPLAPEAEPEAVAEPSTIEAEPQVAPAAEPELAAEPEPGPEVGVAAAAEAEPLPPEVPSAPRRDDVVEAPTWRIVAPDGTDAVAPAPAAPVPSTGPRQSPQWPVQQGEPQWPTASWPPAASVSHPAPAASAFAQLPQARAEAVWAESSRDVLSRPGSGVQACVSCGLPLSATARFCRRCGSRQG